MRCEVLTVMRVMVMFLWVLAPCIFNREDGDNMSLRNVGIYRRVYTAPKPRRTSSSEWDISNVNLQYKI
jgi:hypothetical protein